MRQLTTYIQWWWILPLSTLKHHKLFCWSTIFKIIWLTFEIVISHLIAMFTNIPIWGKRSLLYKVKFIWVCESCEKLWVKNSQGKIVDSLKFLIERKTRKAYIHAISLQRFRLELLISFYRYFPNIFVKIISKFRKTKLSLIYLFERQELLLFGKEHKFVVNWGAGVQILWSPNWRKILSWS